MSNLGVQEGEQDDGEGEEKRKHNSCKNVVNFFFTGFPPEWNEKNLRELFAEVGEIKDVYVARKMSKEVKDSGLFDFSELETFTLLKPD